MQILDVVAGILVDSENNILVCRRSKTMKFAGLWEFPGGKVEKLEEKTQAIVRELQEEFTINILPEKELFRITNTFNDRSRQESYFLVNNFTGTPELGGEEKERMDENNQYSPEWVSLSNLAELPLFPEEAKTKIMSLYV